MITLTERAAAKLRELLERERSSTAALRLRVTAGGCSRLRYNAATSCGCGESFGV